jgi:hypothetical protein
MLRKSFVFVVMGTVMFLLAATSSAQVPTLMSYQGKLTSASGGCVNDTVQMTFTIYADSFGTTSEWTETQTEVVVREGVFSVLLGSVNHIPGGDTVFDGSIKYLGVQVESDPEMEPLKPMVSVAYAHRAGGVDCSDCDDRFVNVEGPEIVNSDSGIAFRGIVAGSSTTNMYGIAGSAENASSGPACGGDFSASSYGTGNHFGVIGHAYTASSSYALGSKGRAQSTSTGAATGVDGWAENSSTGPAYGGNFCAIESGTGEHFGLMAAAYGSSSASAHGSYGYAHSTSTGAAYGTQGEAMNSSSGSAYGAHFYVHDVGSGSKYGVLAVAPVSNGYAGYFQGRVMISDALTVLGDKSAAVKVDDGEYRLLYCQESPENWFEDFGEGRLADGKAVIEIDPLFAQTVNTSVKYHVFLTPQDEPLTLAVANKTAASFEVIGPAGANISFSYRIVAKRKGYENVRLARMGGPTPEEAAAEQEKARMEQERMQEEKQADSR